LLDSGSFGLSSPLAHVGSTVGDVMAVCALLLEDQGLVRAGMMALLKAMPGAPEVYAVASFEQAVACLEHHQFDVAFLDIDLGNGPSGLDLLPLLRLKQQACRAIMLSGVDDRQMVLDCLDAGACGFIPKAVEDTSVFARALEVVFNDGIFLPASVLGMGSCAIRRTTGEGADIAPVHLSERLWEVLYYLCQGLPNKSIANAMGISEGTVRKAYVSELLRKFGVTRRTELMIAIADRNIRVPRPKALGR
jgi:two-component system nitrate/nitrite response regulator NarL